MNILEEANKIVTEGRKSYGSPKKNHRITAEFWSTYLGIQISPRQVCMMNILQKASRDVTSDKRDNLVDIAGFALNAQIVSEPEITITIEPPKQLTAWTDPNTLDPRW